MTKNEEYYARVSRYYDEDAADFEARYEVNPVLQRIRQSFREQVKRHRLRHVLEIGSGPGFDLAHFARIMPETQWYGIDISEEMCTAARRKIAEYGCENVRVECGGTEDIADRFPGLTFDMVYVFFGALNTVADLERSAKDIYDALAPGGRAVLTFVNKYYAAGTAIELLKLRPRAAFARMRKIWGGYSPVRRLDSKCYSFWETKAAFADFRTEYARGYSIFYPAWYYRGLRKRIPDRILQFLWQADERIATSGLGRLGEYSLFVFRKPAQVGQDLADQ